MHRHGVSRWRGYYKIRRPWRQNTVFDVLPWLASTGTYIQRCVDLKGMRMGMNMMMTVASLKTINKYNKYNINWRDIQRNNVANNVDRSIFRAPWQNNPYKNIQLKQHETRRTTRRNCFRHLEETNVVYFMLVLFFPKTTKLLYMYS